MRALIGSSGFVGSNLAAQSHFDEHYRSTNIGEIAGRELDEIVCAGAPAAKWKANADPVADRANIDSLLRALGKVKAARFILISTVDVFPTPDGVDETTPIDESAQHPYGTHRYLLERFVRDHFDSMIVRLPALYGRNLMKNAIYDLLHGNQIEKIHQDGSFQFYGLDRLTSDLDIATSHNLRLVHFATEPASMRQIAGTAFGLENFDNGITSPPPRYDMRTVHAGAWGRDGHYLETRAEVLEGVTAFVRHERGTKQGSR